MIGLFCFVLAVLASPFKSKLRLEAENAVLRHQLMILRRRLHGRVGLTNHDRWFLYPAVSLVSINPEGSHDHKARDARALAQGRISALLGLEIASTGRAAASGDRAARADPTDEYREPTLGRATHSRRTAQARFEVAQSSVAKYMVKRRVPPSQGWRTFLRNHAQDIAAMDLFVVPTIGFDLLYAFVIVRLDRRELVWINVTAHPTAEWVARQIAEAFPWNEARRYMIRDRDRIYGAVVTRRLRAMGIRDKPIAPASPWQNGFAERLIGSVRRECLDHIIVLGEAHLRRILKSNETHLALDKDAPLSRTVKRAGRILCRPILGGLHHEYVRI
jgi:transposase InsO family protein